MNRRNVAISCSILALSGFQVPPALSAAPVASGKATPGPLVLIGGGTDEPALMGRAVALAGGPQARIAIFSLASAHPPVSGAAYVSWLAELGSGARYVPVETAGAAGAPETLGAIAEASLLFFSGGAQNRIVDRLRDSPAAAAVAAAHARGVVVAGTSAGAMPWGTTYIRGGTSEEAMSYGFRRRHFPGLDVSRGLGLVPGLVVDSHFSSRARLGRLLLAVADVPGTVGIGIDEGTAAIFADRTVEVAGSGSVTVVEAPDLAWNNAHHASGSRLFRAGPFAIQRLVGGQTYRLGSGRQASRQAPSPGPPGHVIEAGIWRPGRIDRLLRKALDGGRVTGFGLGDETHVAIDGDLATIRGRGQALVIESGNASREAPGASGPPGQARDPERPAAATDLAVSVLAAGDQYDLARRIPLFQGGFSTRAVASWACGGDRLPGGNQLPSGKALQEISAFSRVTNSSRSTLSCLPVRARSATDPASASRLPRTAM